VGLLGWIVEKLRGWSDCAGDVESIFSQDVILAHVTKEEPMPPRSWVERGYDLRRWTELPRGGHFAAMEQPALLARDIRDFFRPLRRARVA
jgi:pimeloyl-ACP methyl ester carboxylesterase